MQPLMHVVVAIGAVQPEGKRRSGLQKVCKVLIPYEG